MTTTARKDLESWKNVTVGAIYVRRLDHRGDLSNVEEVNGGRVFHLSPEERRINSEAAASEDLDFFANGQMQPVRLLDDGPEAKELASNPNLLSESDMKALMTVHAKTFEARIKSIRNPTTLQRLLQVAHDEDASIKRVQLIEFRLGEIAPSVAGMPRRAAPEPMPGVPSRSNYGRAVTPH